MEEKDEEEEGDRVDIWVGRLGCMDGVGMHGGDSSCQRVCMLRGTTLLLQGGRSAWQESFPQTIRSCEACAGITASAIPLEPLHMQL